MAVSAHYFTPQEYLRRELETEEKLEYFDGQIVAMSGVSSNHSRIESNLHFQARSRLAGSGCDVWVSSLRVRSPSMRTYAHPDLSITCGEARIDDMIGETLLNPIALFEILSPSTERFDRGEKFERYRGIESLNEYILVTQAKPLIEVFERRSDGWLLRAFTGIDAVLRLSVGSLEIPLSEVYESVAFDSADGGSAQSDL
jgi:Uma2 family endonuclease